MTPSQIKTELEARNNSLTKVSRELGCARQTVSIVVRGKRRSARIESAIAEALGKATWQVFPDRYPTPPDARIPEMVAISREQLDTMRRDLIKAAYAIEQLTA